MSESIKDLSFLAAKAALACLVALLLDRLVGNPDSVSSTFVAVLCVSPVILMGLRQAWSQLVGSVLGGIWGALALQLDLPVLAGVPLAVGLAILTVYLARVPSGYPIAAFTALYLILVPRDTPLDTLGVRLLAVSCGATAGFLVNLVVSAIFYRGIFRDRLRLAERQVRELLGAAVRGGPDAAEPGFALLAGLQGDLGQALEELRWRRAWTTHAAIQEMWSRVEHLRFLLHLASNVGLIARQEGIEETALEPCLAWIEEPSGPPPPVPGALREPVGRIEKTLDVLQAEMTHGRSFWE